MLFELIVRSRGKDLAVGVLKRSHL